jgi:hypothetical protein
VSSRPRGARVARRNPRAPRRALSVSVDLVQTLFNWEWAFAEHPDGVDRWAWWARDIRLDPSEVIASDGEGGTWRVPFSTDGESTITFSAPERVREDYVPASPPEAVSAFALHGAERPPGKAATAGWRRPAPRARSPTCAEPAQRTSTRPRRGPTPGGTSTVTPEELRSREPGPVRGRDRRAGPCPRPSCRPLATRPNPSRRPRRSTSRRRRRRTAEVPREPVAAPRCAPRSACRRPRPTTRSVSASPRWRTAPAPARGPARPADRRARRLVDARRPRRRDRPVDPRLVACQAIDPGEHPTESRRARVAELAALRALRRPCPRQRARRHADDRQRQPGQPASACSAFSGLTRRGRQEKN